MINLKSFFGIGNNEKTKGSYEPEVDLNNDGIIGEYFENDLPVIVKFVNQIPNNTTQKKMSILTVISWKYDGSQRNGMPIKEVNQRMIKLEKAIANSSSVDEIFRNAYSRTGNNLKELVYYSSSQDEFMQKLSKALSKHETYPIEIKFYEDKEWSEFKKLLSDFKKNEKN